MNIIINADDFGISHGANIAIVDAFQNKYITSTSIMMKQQFTNEAIELWRNNKEIMSVGLHFEIEDYENLSELSVEHELEYQLKKAMNSFSGAEITHINVHHDINLWNDKVRNAVNNISKKYNIPCRNFENYTGKLWYMRDCNRYEIIKYILDAKANDLKYFEIGVHILADNYNVEDEIWDDLESRISERIFLEKNLNINDIIYMGMNACNFSNI
ncbi:MAG: ChbG/HpnK family deacetylase [Mycoplasma sp.]